MTRTHYDANDDHFLMDDNILIDDWPTTPMDDVAEVAQRMQVIYIRGRGYQLASWKREDDYTLTAKLIDWKPF